MVGAVVEDTEHPEVPVEELPTFGCYVKYSRYTGSAFALGLNGWIFDIISGRAENKNGYPIYSGDDLYQNANGTALVPKEWEHIFNSWLCKQFPLANSEIPKIVLAGKNVAKFDYQFLSENIQRRFYHRMIDPGSCFIDWSLNSPQSLDDLKKGFNIAGEVTHDAVEDARDVIRVLRAGTHSYSF